MAEKSQSGRHVRAADFKSSLFFISLRVQYWWCQEETYQHLLLNDISQMPNCKFWDMINQFWNYVRH